MRDTADAIVIGAGLSGLVAARRLVEGGLDDVIVLDGRDRVGGRTLNRDLGDGQVVEAGGQWAARSHTGLLSLARELGVGTFPTWDEGSHVLWLRGRRRLYRGDPPLRAAPVALLDFAQSVARLDRMARKLPHGEPWRAPKAERWDALTLESWLRRATVTATARRLWALVAALTLGGEPRDVSLLFALHHVRGAGGLSALMDVVGGAQELRFEGGSQELSLRLAAALGKRISLSTPVERIEQTGDEVTVRHSRGEVRAAFAIVAMSPADAGRIAVSPALPRGRSRLQRRATMVSGWKVQAVYDEPFWREEGLSGQSLSDTGPLALTYDNSPPSGRPGVLMGFTGYQTDPRLSISADLARDPKARRQAILECLARYFGPRALKARDYFEQDWGAEPHTEGCIPSFPPGLLTEAGEALVEPVGRIHWAGAESATAWDGYMEGAVEAGERAAREILQVKTRYLT
jgi:monoamine oxidase